MSPPESHGDVHAETLALFDSRDDPSEPLTTREVADALDCASGTATDRLEKLAVNGDLRAKRVGDGDAIWWRPPWASLFPEMPSPDESGLPSLVSDALDSASIGVFVLDADFTVAWVNEAASRYFGIDRSDAIGRDKRQLIRESITDAVSNTDEFIDTVLATYDNNTYDETFECRITPGDDGESHWLEHHSKPIESGRYAGGRVEFYYDITDRKLANDEQQLQLSVSRSIANAESLEDGLRTALEDVCEWTDWTGGQAWVPSGDGSVERLTDASVESSAFAAFGEASTDFTFGPGEGIPGRVLETSEPVWFPDVSAVPETVYPRTDLADEVGMKAGLGVPVIVDGEVAVVLEFYMFERRTADERQVDTVSSVAAELGSFVAQKRAEDALNRERVLLEQMMESAPVGISVLSSNGEIDRANSRSLALRGLSDEDIERFHVGDQTFYDQAGEPIPFEDQPFAKVIETGEPVYDWTAQVELPDRFSRSISINAAPILNSDGDIEQVVTVEEDITEIREQYRAITEAASDVIITVDETSTVRSVNPAVADVFGYSQAELTGEPLAKLMPEDLTEQHDEALRRYLETGERTIDWDYVELPGVRADGTDVPLAISFSEIEHEGDTLFTGIIRDITERKERESELELFRNLIDHSNDGVFVIDPETAQFLDINDTACHRLGRDRAELLDMTVLDIETNLPDFDAFRDHVKELRAKDSLTFEGAHRRADGTTVPVEVNVTHVELDQEYMLAVARDITERMKYQRKLEESNERLEQFAYAASHDLKEPLRMVSSYLQLIEKRYADELDEDGQEFLDFAVDGADRMGEMIDGLLEYSRVDTQGEPLEPVELDAVVEDVLEDLQFRIEESDAEITTESLPRVEGDASQLRQVFQNLVSNAIEYSDDGPLRIHISGETEGNKQTISVSDNGIGIDPDDTERIFRVFQRLHSPEEHAGTGIGLALSRRIVERHGGDIWVDSEPGEGSTFSFTLPPAED
ncbi:PAS domain S-box protein [Halostella sp. PRR32]|uniref:PAS domain S-box protein n=1 Tax=Halostella sp. PRR32 TaxID=3098147 RepID=UPI002B1D89A8|nr:PAS domain S-box protein [Halostella sp. PRR32]